MGDLLENISQAVVEVPVAAVRRMLGLIRLLDRFSRDLIYREYVYAQVPDSAKFDPGHDAVMMCYDFHLTDGNPRLIEVNTNAGGSLLAYLAHYPVLPLAVKEIHPRTRQRLLKTFSREISQFSHGKKNKPEHLLILDENPAEQHLYPEMLAFAELFEDWGVPAAITSPEQLEVAEQGIFYEGKPVDFVYNRHCDFYLKTDVMAGLLKAYLSGKVCLSPNPHMYGLLADKRRMMMWSKMPGELMEKCSEREQALCKEMLLPCELLGNLDRDEVWSVRKQKIFKPVDSFGSRGVLLGAKISRKRYNELVPEKTIVQDLAPPSMTHVDGFGEMKTDLRVYAYRNKLLGFTARLYRGQVTNMRTEGGGFARVRFV